MPATVGLGLLLGYTMVRPLLDGARQQGRINTVAAVAVLLGSTLLAALGRTPVLAILWGGGALSALVQWMQMARQGPPQ